MNRYIGNQRKYLLSFYEVKQSAVSCTIEGLRDISRNLTKAFNEIVEMIGEVNALSLEIDKVKQRIDDVISEWKLVGEYCTETRRAAHRDCGIIADELQKRLLQPLDLLSKIESRITAIKITVGLSYGCTKAMELVEKERKHLCEMYDHCVSFKSGDKRADHFITEISDIVAKKHHLEDIKYVWDKFWDITSYMRWMEDIESSYTLPSLATPPPSTCSVC